MQRIKLPDPMRRRKNKLPTSLRTHKDERRYQTLKEKRADSQKALDVETPLQQWDHWKLIVNSYPYSAAFKVHHMLIPKRVVSESELNSTERRELDEIVTELSDNYDCLLVNFTSKQSIRNHFHLHLLVYKDKRSDLAL